ncbi:MAG: TolC family protein, partial [Candidatus Omnitrophica bacterium]|nr:TolC family protein [Candidatus Omnitrophota bacterium]
MKKIAIVLIATIPLLLSQARAEDIALSLEEAFIIALRDNRDILLKEEDLKKAKAKIKEADSALMPSLSVSAAWSQTRGYYEKELGQDNAQLGLKQYLYKGGRIQNTIKQSKDKIEVSRAQLDKTKAEVIFNVKKAFYTLMLSAEYADLNKEIFENSLSHLAAVKERYRMGQASESEVLGIEGSLSNVEEAYAVSLSQKEASLALLRNLLYLDEKVNLIPEADLKYEPKEFAYEEAFLRAMKVRPEIRQYEAQENSDKKAIEILKADNRPSVYASWDYYTRSRALATTSKNRNDYNVIGLTFSWPVFDGWATKAKIDQAIIDLKETQLYK